MSGISSSTGLISGINSGSIIDQLIQVESRPKQLVQRRVLELQRQSAAVLDINGRLTALQTAAAKFFSSRTFAAVKATSSADAVLGATASVGAPAGSYTFLVDRTVSTQQLLTRAFVDRNSTSVGSTGITVEPTTARLDSDTELASLNGGQGVSRGKIVITDRAGVSATVDLSRTGTINEVLSAINGNGTARVRASVSGGKLVLTDSSSGTGNLTVASGSGYTTAESLGIAKTIAGNTINGDTVFSIGDNTTIASLRDGAGIRFNTAAGTSNADFSITTNDGGTFQVDLGDQYNTAGVKTSGPIGTIAQLKQRVLAQTNNKVSVSIRPDGRGIQFVDGTTGSGSFTLTANSSSGAAEDLGITGAAVGSTITSSTLLAGLNSTLGSGIPALARDGAIEIRTRSGATYSFNVDLSGSISDVLDSISSTTGGNVTGKLNANGNGIILTDTSTPDGTSTLRVQGGGATTLGVETAVGGVTGNTVTGNRVQRQYVQLSTRLSTLNGGQGVGSGTFRVVGSRGVGADINIGSDVNTVEDLIKRINQTTGQTGVRASINDTGTGIKVDEDPGASGGGAKITISDSSGTVSRSLNIAGTAAEVGVGNVIDGSFRRTVKLDAGDTLDTVIAKVNTAKVGITASVVTDGSSGTPFRIRFGSTLGGSAGRFQFESDGADLATTTIAAGTDARVFFGSEDAARGILISRPTNSIDGVVDGLRLNVLATSATPVTVTVSRDQTAIETDISAFVDAFNSVSSRVSKLTTTDPDGTNKGALVGDSTALSLRQELFSTIFGNAQGVSGQYRNLSQVGLTISRDGTLSLNSTKLQEALQNDSQAVADLFAARVQVTPPTTTQVLPGVPGVTTPTTTTDPTFTSLGVAERINRLASRYLDSTRGLLTGSNKSLTDQIERQNKRIADFDIKLASKRAQLTAQFSNLESSLAKLQQQQGALSRISGSQSTGR